ncbi:MAG: RHS repeat-associated core domain-containing protein, partial [Nitrospira sp.]|nr:RHS repeat-associated core domain-containing protein [Nitrospira sp.]
NYDDAGRRTSLDYPNGVVTSYGYDNANRLLTIGHVKTPTTIESFTYTYDKNGNRITQVRQNAAASNLPTVVSAANIAYDAANELTRWNSATTNLTYDNNGNLTTETQGGVTTSYTWDGRNRLTGISRSGLTANFLYDGVARRKSKTINGTTTGFWYDGNDVYAELTGGTPSATYIRGLSIDEPYIRKAASDEFYETDALGNSIALTDATGVSQTTYTYEPFGNTTQAGTASGNALQYTGRENDGTGLYYYRARYYSPLSERFISEDPIGFAGGDANRYAYVQSAPLSWSDPSGLRVYISGHAAAGPVGQFWTTPPSYHLSLVLVPDDPIPFQGRPGWESNPGTGVGPYPSQTLGAHPDISLTLRSTPNYSSDNLQSGQYSQLIPTPPGLTDTQFINNLVKAASCFRGMPYSAPDRSGYMGAGEYNSNSYVAGLIIAVGGLPPPLNPSGQWQAPGYTNPVPLSSFGKSCGRQ